MKSNKITTLDQWTSAKKFDGLCDECVNKVNKTIGTTHGRDLCRNHFIREINAHEGEK